jgi:hypothetical protein
LDTALRDSPVMRAISRFDFLCRLCSRRILPIMPTVITPNPLPRKAAGSVEHLAQFSVGASNVERLEAIRASKNHA